MEHKDLKQDPETAQWIALGRAFAKRRRSPKSSLIGMAMLAAFAWVALVGVPFVMTLHSAYFWVLAMQLIVPWILYGLAVGHGPDAVALSWFCSYLISCVLLTAYNYVSLLNRLPAIEDACIAGAILVAAMIVHRPEMLEKRKTGGGPFILPSVFCFAVLYSYIAIFQINCLLDKSSFTVYRTVVLDVYGSRGRGSRGLLVQQWSQEQGQSPVFSFTFGHGTAMAPPGVLLNVVHKGDTICVVQRAGRLGMSWYTAQLCPWNGGRVALGPWGGSF
jgi:hypothetical protein